MKKRIETRIQCMIDWLENDTCNYTKDDFKAGVNRIINAINESEFVDILTTKQANELRELVTYKTIKYFN